MKVLTIIILLFSLCCWGWSQSDFQVEISAFVNRELPGSQFLLHTLPVQEEWKKQVTQIVKEAFLDDTIQAAWLKKDGKKQAYLLVDKAWGKSHQVVIAVIYDLQGKVSAVQVLQDSSPHKSRLNNPGWIRQFKGSHSGSRLQPGRQIDSISGSTYSVRGLCRAVWRLNLLYPSILIILSEL